MESKVWNDDVQNHSHKIKILLQFGIIMNLVAVLERLWIRRGIFIKSFGKADVSSPLCTP